MSDEAPWPPQAFVSAGDFRRVDFNALLSEVSSVYDHTLEAVLMKAARTHRDVEPDFSVYRLLGSVCGLHFRIHDKAGVFGPQIVFEGRRSPIPEDWQGSQNDAFAEIVGDLQHPALRARLADVIWTNDRRKGAAAKLAIDAYCECVEGVLADIYTDRFPSERAVSIEEVDLIERALQLHELSSKRGAAPPERLANLMRTLYAKALEHLAIVPLRRLADFMLRHGLIDNKELASDIVRAATAATGAKGAYPLAIKELWDFAASIHGDAGRPDEQRRCRLEGVEETLKMAIENNSASAQAHWYRQAIGELRTIPGTEEKRSELHNEMRRLQEKSLEEMGSFSTPIDLREIVEQVEKEFGQLSLPDALWQFALFALPTAADKMREEALEQRGGIADLFPQTHLDHDGKIVAEVEGALGAAPTEEWIKSKMVQNQGIHISIAVAGQLEPARRLLSSAFPLSERHFRPLVSLSPFVPRTHIGTFAAGFARMMQGDMLTAGHLLIPQLENCLRYVLVNSGSESSKMRNDLTQEDRSLSSLLELYREDLERIFSKDFVLQIDLLFNHRPGPALRHEFAHGKVGDGAYSATVFYACCFMLVLTCAPLRSIWSEQVAPAIEQATF